MLLRLFSFSKSFLQALLLFLILSFVADRWRAPAPDTADARLSSLLPASSIPAKFSHERVSVVYFWGSWCKVCRYTSPNIEKLYRSGTPVVSIALQSGDDHAVTHYMKAHQLNFPVLNDSDGLISGKWGIFATPTVIFIKNGKIIHHTTGFSSYWGLRARAFLSGLLL